MVAEYSPKYFCELELVYKYDYLKLKLQSEELESFFVNWANRIPQKSLSLIISDRYNMNSLVKNMEIINKYIKAGIIKKFVKF